VLTSPRTRVTIGTGTDEAKRLAHEILSYTAWRFSRVAVSALMRVNTRLKPLLHK
jgi:hypothetical protein